MLSPEARAVLESVQPTEPPKILTIRQPYAEQILRGEKKVENRSWATKYRGLLLIHAGASKQDLCDDDLDKYPEMSFGGIVGGCVVVDCVELGELGSKYPQLKGHRHATGPFCWVLERPFRLDFHRLKGRLGLWSAPEDLLDDLGIDLCES